MLESFRVSPQSSSDGEHDGDRLDDEGPLAQVAADDEPAEDRLDLGDAGAAGVRREHPDEAGGERREPDRPQHVQEVHDEVGPGAVGALREAEHLGPREPVRAVARYVDDCLV